MADEFDAFEWLKQRDPIEHVQDPLDEPGLRQAVFDRAVTRSTVRRRRSRRLIPVVAAAAVFAAAGSAVAAVLIIRSSSPDPATVLCYGDVRVDASRASVDPGDDPIAACQQAWADSDYTEIFNDRPLPPLAACTLPSGITAVFPADRSDPCQTLGIAAAGTPPPQDERIRAFTDEVTEALDDGCISMTTVEQTVRDALHAAALDDWSVVVEPATSTNVCGSIDIDPVAGTVRILAVPPAPPPG